MVKFSLVKICSRTSKDELEYQLVCAKYLMMKFYTSLSQKQGMYSWTFCFIEYVWRNLFVDLRGVWELDTNGFLWKRLHRPKFTTPIYNSSFADDEFKNAPGVIGVLMITFHHNFSTYRQSLLRCAKLINRRIQLRSFCIHLCHSHGY